MVNASAAKGEGRIGPPSRRGAGATPIPVLAHPIALGYHRARFCQVPAEGNVWNLTFAVAANEGACVMSHGPDHDPPPTASAGPPSAPDLDRRRFLGAASSIAMGCGLVAGYGALGAIAARFVYPAKSGEAAWMFVIDMAGAKVGESIAYRTPAGEAVTVARIAHAGTAADFIALSSTCPHLGCQVKWEPQNNRFFCPCHNGTFDPSGKATGGPPGEAGQALLRFPLKVDGGNLFIQVPLGTLGAHLTESDLRLVRIDDRPGHDPCLGCRGRAV